MAKATTERMRRKKYRCKECGHEKMQETNHYGQCYGMGNYNQCPTCPPYMRPTTWECVEPMPEHLDRPADWQKTTLGDIAEIITFPKQESR